MISSSFPSIVLQPDGPTSCFPSRRWGKPRVGAERRSGDLGVQTLAPDSLLNPFRDPERQTPAQSPLALPPIPSHQGLGQPPVGYAWRLAGRRGPARQVGKARQCLTPSTRGRTSTSFASPRRLHLAGGSIQTGAQDRFGPGG